MNKALHDSIYRPFITNKNFAANFERTTAKVTQLDEQRKAVVDLLDARMP